MTDTTQPSFPQQLSAETTAAAATLPRKLEEEFSAMEAVRELLVGRRMTEVHTNLTQVRETLGTELQRLDGATRAELQSLKATAQRETELLTGQIRELQQRSVLRDEKQDSEITKLNTRVSSVEATFNDALAKLEARMESSMHTLRAELAYIRQTVPTSDQLAMIFRGMAQRMRDVLEPAAAQANPILNAAAPAPAPSTHLRQAAAETSVAATILENRASANGTPAPQAEVSLTS